MLCSLYITEYMKRAGFILPALSVEALRKDFCLHNGASSPAHLLYVPPEIGSGELPELQVQFHLARQNYAANTQHAVEFLPRAFSVWVEGTVEQTQANIYNESPKLKHTTIHTSIHTSIQPLVILQKVMKCYDNSRSTPR